MKGYPSFSEHLRARYGRNWCVAQRASRKTVRYDTVIHPKRYKKERLAWIAGHPVFQYADSLPAGEEKDFIMQAVVDRLGCC